MSHTHHGPGVVIGRQRRMLRDELREYLVILIEHAQLRVLIPEDAIDQIGLRPVMDRHTLTDVLHILGEEPRPVLDAWNARRKDIRARLAGGDVTHVAALVRDLEGRSADRDGLSAVERSMLQSWRRRLVFELALAMSLAPEAIEARLDALVGRRAVA